MLIVVVLMVIIVVVYAITILIVVKIVIIIDSVNIFLIDYLYLIMNYMKYNQKTRIKVRLK